MATITFFQFSYQSYSIGFADWISLLTLSLAPLIAHIIAGCPPTSLISSNGNPRWHQTICHYNPTSILWRYGLIVDRRIRAKSWNPLEMAAANALFWTSHGWDGSEDIVLSSTKHCGRLPRSAIVNPVSGTMFKTVVTTLQGTQALVVISGALTGQVFGSTFNPTLGVDLVFWPLSIIGLLRLCSALWLTDEYYFCSEKQIDRPVNRCKVPYASSNDLMRKASFDGLLDLSTNQSADMREQRFYPPSYWPSRVFRALFLSSILGIWVLSILWVIPLASSDFMIYFSITSFVVVLFYIFFTAMTAVIIPFYLVRGNRSTIIPCIDTLWYKIYSIALMAFAVTIFAIASLETRKGPCGSYTSAPGRGDLYGVCGNILDPNLRAVEMNPQGDQSSVGFGLAFHREASLKRNITVPDPRDFWVANFSGFCLGYYTNPVLIQLSMFLDTVAEVKG
ncbi:hypothetical protein F4860DRAFT_519603 [Xylaria cubensis]|nr:hypothetical protein F4860DRAFT_519603 [Xylaria cubensis]